MSVSVLGGGAFGTALAIAIARGHPVTLWARDAEAAADMQTRRENTQYLAGAPFPENLTVTGDLDEALQAGTLLFAVPMQVLGALVGPLDLSGKTAIACCKGIDLTTGQGPSALLSGAAHVAVLTGPSFAKDIALGLPTALTLAGQNEEVMTEVQKILSTPALRLYRSTDVIGAETGGALKNVIAIACGAAMGAGLGDSARAALMTRGFAEMRRVAKALGAHPETLGGLSGLGDLTLTCTSAGSRNYRLGLALGSGAAFDARITVEGAATARALRTVAAHRGLDLPICATVADLVDGNVDVASAIQNLLARPLKEE